MLRSCLWGLLPIAAAVQLPLFPSPGDAFSAADSYLHQHASTVLSPGNDISLASVPNDEHLIFTSVRHPVSRPPFDGPSALTEGYPGAQDEDQVP